MTAQGLFIVFEGGDAVGKTTQVAWLAAALRQAGLPHVVTFEPGATWLGTRVRDLVLNPASGPICPPAEALLYVADKAQHVAEVIKPAMERGAVVVSDRYTDSVIAYQGAGRELDADEIERLATWATNGLLPDLTVVLDADPDAAVAGITSKDRLEGAGLDLHRRARQRFLDLAARDANRYLVLPARDRQASIAAAVRQRLAACGLTLSAPRGMMDA
ncbi:MAG: dTMP kinase [Propionibacteriaceae bacterium]|nr:dTMP kinase [Propionibacteriaceae bacterium]